MSRGVHRSPCVRVDTGSDVKRVARDELAKGSVSESLMTCELGACR